MDITRIFYMVTFLLAIQGITYAEAFHFETAREVAFKVKVTHKKQPVARARISLASPRCFSEKCISDSKPYAHYWRGVTDENGMAVIRVMLPTDERTVELSVNKFRFKGKYTNRRLRKKLGLFAPSSVLKLKVGRLLRKQQVTVKLKSSRR